MVELPPAELEPGNQSKPAMNLHVSGPNGRFGFDSSLANAETAVLIVAADTASFCILQELHSDRMSGQTCAELAPDTPVMVIFSPGRSAAAVVSGCEQGILSARFKQPVDVDAALDGAALFSGGDPAIRIPPFRVDRQVEILRHGQSTMVNVQDISPRAARIASAELCPGDEITFCMGGQSRHKATVRWTQGGIAGIAFSPALPFAELANWIVEQQFHAAQGSEATARNRSVGSGASSIVHKLFVVDPDFRRRAAVCHALGDMSLHVEPFAEPSELAGFRTDGALVLVHDDGKAIAAINQCMAASGAWLPLIAYSEPGKPGFIVQAIKQGALDYLTWPFTPALVADTLERISPDIERKSEETRRRRHAITLVNRLSDRERQILNAMISGHANRHIADHTGLSVRTVETHRANVLRKMGANHSSEAIRLGLEAGLTVESF